ITEGNPASHLAGNQRLFSDGHLASFGSNLSHSAAPAATSATLPVATNLSQSLPLASTPQNFNVSANALGQGGDALPAVPQAQEAVSQTAASAPSAEAAQAAPESTSA